MSKLVRGLVLRCAECRTWQFKESLHLTLSEQFQTIQSHASLETMTDKFF